MIPKEVEEKAKSVLAKNSFSAENGDEIIVNQKDEDIYHAYVKTKNPGAFGHMVINGKDLSFLWANSSVSPDVLIDKMKCGTKQQNNGSVCSCGKNCTCGNGCNCANKKTKKCKCLPFIIILSITTLGSLALAGYEMWLNNQKPDTTTNVEEKEEPEVGTKCDVPEIIDNTIQLPEVEALVKKFSLTAFPVYGLYPLKDGLTERYKYYATMIALDYQSKEDSTIQEDGYANVGLTYDEVNEKYHELFGDDTDVATEDISFCGIPVLRNGKYQSLHACGGTSPTWYTNKIVDYVIEGDALTVEIVEIGITDSSQDNRKAHIETVNGTKEYYSYDSAKIYDEFKNELPYYNLTFEKSGDHYTLIKIEEK